MMHDWYYSFSFGLGPIGMLIAAAIIAFPFWRICEKAGYPGVLGLLALVPVINVIFIYWFALTEWPNARPTDRPD